MWQSTVCQTLSVKEFWMNSFQRNLRLCDSSSRTSLATDLLCDLQVTWLQKSPCGLQCCSWDVCGLATSTSLRKEPFSWACPIWCYLTDSSQIIHGKKKQLCIYKMFSNPGLSVTFYPKSKFLAYRVMVEKENWSGMVWIWILVLPLSSWVSWGSYFICLCLGFLIWRMGVVAQQSARAL